MIDAAADDPAFCELRAELPALLDPANAIRSITVGVNLNDGLIPVEVAVLSVNCDTFRESGFLGRISSMHGESTIGRLHSVKDSQLYSDPSMIPLFRDVAHSLNTAMKPLSRALKRFGRMNGTLFVKLMDEFVFFLGATKLIGRLRERGLPMVRPKIHPAGEQLLVLRGMYNIDLALREGSDRIVRNDLGMDAHKRLFILTGPNSGGKTTFLQAVGLVQLLAQVGLYVPADRAEISLCDGVFTHYPNLEEPGKDSGRFGEEADRLRSIFGRLSGRSLLLLNETLSSTSMGEALYLAEDLLRVLAKIGTRVIYVTHLHQLAAGRDRIVEGSRGDSPVESLVAGITAGPDGRVAPSFVVRPGEPLGRSYADELAVKHGISREQLEEMVSRDQAPCP